MAKKDFKDITLNESETDFNLNMVAKNVKRKRGEHITITPLRKDYCIRIQPSVKNKLDKYCIDNHFKQADIIETAILEYLSKDK